MKLDLLTNATVVDDAIRFVANGTNRKIKPSSSNDDDRESCESNNDEDQLERKQKGQTVEISQLQL